MEQCRPIGGVTHRLVLHQGLDSYAENWLAPSEQVSLGNDFLTVTGSIPDPVPESGTYALMGLALLGYCICRRRRKAS